MADKLDNVKVGYNWRVVQITGSANADITNYMTFETPVEIRRVEATTSVTANSIKIFIDRDGSGAANQQSIVAQTPPAAAGCVGLDNRWLTHPFEFKLERPQTQVEELPNSGGKLYIVTDGGGDWTLTVEVRG